MARAIVSIIDVPSPGAEFTGICQMRGVLSSVTALLFSAAVLLVGHGLQLTLVPLYADGLGWSPRIIGVIGSAYYVGFMAGCLTVPALVERVGHIRVFGVLASSATAALLLLSIVELPLLWAAARFCTGWCFAGIYMVIESWLNERSASEHRGGVLSVYTVIALVAICAGQAFIGLGLTYGQLAMAAAALISLGMVPVSLTRSPSPEPIPAVSFKIGSVLRGSHVAVAGAFFGGFVTAGFWTMGPVVARAQGLAADQIAIFMAATLLGGALFQWPVGRLSDRVDRRFVILAASLLGVVVSISAPLAGAFGPTALYVPMFLFGGLTFPLYSLSLAHANDNTGLQLIDVASVMLLMSGAGSVLGPIFVALLMDYTPFAMFVVAGIMLAVLAVWTGWRMTLHESAPEFFTPYVVVPRTAHTVTDMVARETTANSDPGAGTVATSNVSETRSGAEARRQ